MAPPPMRRRLAAVATLVVAGALAFGTTSATGAPTHKAPKSAAAAAEVADYPTGHTQQAYDPEDSSFTAKWRRDDAIKNWDWSDPNAAPKTNSMSKKVTMPNIPVNFPVMKAKNGRQVWVWDTWPMTDGRGNQYSYKGWNVIFALSADPYAGYTFDDRHVNARISYWYSKGNQKNPKWIYGGLLFGNTTPSTQAEWSGSTRIFDGNNIKVFYTHMNFADRNKPVAQISLRTGKIQANSKKVWFTGLHGHKVLLDPAEGGAGNNQGWYQTNEQNPYFSFRDPFTFTDPANPSKTYMVFEGNTYSRRSTVPDSVPGDVYQCQGEDVGQTGETADEVTAMGANNQLANIGLAVADKSDLSKWHFLPPLLSGNCVNDQTERPQFVIKKVNGQWKYYLFTISHAFTYAAGMRGPDGVYGFVGNGIRSDFAPLNGSGLALGNPTNLNYEPTDSSGQTVRQYQAYSHYVMPGGLVESFIDNVDGRRGGTLAPTVKIDLKGTTSTVDRTVGAKKNGLLGYGYIPYNRSRGSASSAPDSIRTYQAPVSILSLK